MNINSNLINLLRELADAAEKGSINVDININVSTNSTETDQTVKQDSVETLKPDGGPEKVDVIADAEELEAFLSSKGGEDVKADDAGQAEETEKTEAVPSKTESEAKPVEAAAPKEERPNRPKRATVPAAGSNGRCIKMVLQRQKQLKVMNQEVPPELMEAPLDEVHAQQMLSELRPYLVN